MDMVKVDIQKLQLLNDRIAQALEALELVRQSVQTAQTSLPWTNGVHPQYPVTVPMFQQAIPSTIPSMYHQPAFQTVQTAGYQPTFQTGYQPTFQTAGYQPGYQPTYQTSTPYGYPYGVPGAYNTGAYNNTVPSLYNTLGYNTVTPWGTQAYAPFVQNTGFVPQATGFVPQTTGFVPQTTGFVPQTTGFVPQGAGFVPGIQNTGFVPGIQNTGFVPGIQNGGFAFTNGLNSRPTTWFNAGISHQTAVDPWHGRLVWDPSLRSSVGVGTPITGYSVPLS